ncbi:MAG: thioredoxin domain-containing protein [Ilumatobacteraceae bacterium]
MAHQNRLASESSPYLRQHQDNPVDWYPWGEEAFGAALERGVPVLLSVGYSSCHWCHVMAHECFEDTEVAEAMNRLFVNVKVDREERPDVDSVYMDAVQAMTGRGGWPMTVFLTPGGAPFYGGTYFPKEQFLQLLDAIDDVWRNRPDDVQQNVQALVEALARTAFVPPSVDLPDIELVNAGLAGIAQEFDQEWGGFGNAPKFPSTLALELVTRTYLRAGAENAKTVLVTSLDAMASGGMYDHIGGGFARYSTDREWLVPHFEKMLSDQALLARIYAHAASLFGNTPEGERYWQVLQETIGYVLRVLRHPDGGFYSAEDADSAGPDGHHHEGAYYTWTEDEIRAVLGEHADHLLEWYEVTPEGNFEGRTILTRLQHRGELIRPDHIEAACEQLFEARELRPRPGLDDKVILEWNALMLSTLAEAAGLFGRPDWFDAAIANGEFLLREMRSPDGRWYRTWHADGSPKARHQALAADHAALIDAFTRLGELSGQARWIDEARNVAETMLDHFWDLDRGGFFTIPDDGEQLLVRQKDLVDNATPSANSVAAMALYRLAALTGEGRYVQQADQTLKLLGAVMPQAPSAFSYALATVAFRTEGSTEVVITGGRGDMIEAIQRRWDPSVVLAWGEPYESPLWAGRGPDQAFVCRNHTCQLPADTVEEMLAQLD